MLGPLHFSQPWIFHRCHSASNHSKASIIPHKATFPLFPQKQAINVMISPCRPFQIMTSGQQTEYYDRAHTARFKNADQMASSRWTWCDPKSVTQHFNSVLTRIQVQYLAGFWVLGPVIYKDLLSPCTQPSPLFSFIYFFHCLEFKLKML